MGLLVGDKDGCDVVGDDVACAEHPAFDVGQDDPVHAPPHMIVVESQPFDPQFNAQSDVFEPQFMIIPSHSPPPPELDCAQFTLTFPVTVSILNVVRMQSPPQLTVNEVAELPLNVASEHASGPSSQSAVQLRPDGHVILSPQHPSGHGESQLNVCE